MAAVQETVDRVKSLDVTEYKYGFSSTFEMDMAPIGLSEDIVRFISAKKNEPAWLTEWRLEAYRRWITMEEPAWARVHYPPIDYQSLYYYAAPKVASGPKSLDEVDPEILKVYAKLGIPLHEQALLAGVAIALGGTDLLEQRLKRVLRDELVGLQRHDAVVTTCGFSASFVDRRIRNARQRRIHHRDDVVDIHRIRGRVAGRAYAVGDPHAPENFERSCVAALHLG